MVRQLLQDQQNDEDDLVGVNSLNCDAIASGYKDSGKRITFMASRKKIFSLRFARIFNKYILFKCFRLNFKVIYINNDL